MDMGAIRRRLALGTALLSVAGLLVLAGPATGDAQAAALCSGRKVRTLSFATGYVVVHRSRDYVCAVTRPERAGPRVHMKVSVQARGSRPVVDEGRFTRHAGPVTVHAGHRCVWLRGAVGSGSISSGWILC
ncbi:hypothetical protein [Streptomyces fructofermentans]|uniref:Secreted protein n=1 Tax=Streptomyces fructofermentans TaxID=152141 RepID=A0A918K9L0_9ACTN|nr:hypothetical protein [Streptomyces fructofermentans]GGX53893.1 hypothetical protein GCM10010515_21380 [Streptomyces fructofermentans]